MKFNIDSSEAKRILEAHSRLHKHARIITEQTATLKSRLETMMKSGCVGGKTLFIQEFDNYSKPDYQFAIAQESTKTPGKFRYFFIDNKVGQFDAAGKWEWIGKWSCDQYSKDVESDAEKSRIDNLRTSRGAKTYQEWQKEGVEVMDNPDMFDEFSVGATKLYAYKQFDTLGAKSDKAKEVLNGIKAKGGKLSNELNAEERATWNAVVVIQPGSIDFPEGLTAYFPPNKDTRDLVGREYEAERSSTRLSDEELKECEQEIKNWYEDWEANIPLKPSTKASQKQGVQACINQLKMSGFKRLFSKTDEYIDKLTGIKKPGPYADDDYRLQPPRGK